MNAKSFFKLLISFIITLGLTATCILAAYVCTTGGSFMGFEFNSEEETTHINVMLMGLDKGGTRTDVMILGQLNFADEKINMLQIPRDTYVKNNGRGDKKINSGYGYKKEKTVFKEVEQITGIKVDKYVIVNTSSFRDLIDTIGGVDFEVPQDMNYDDPVQDLHIHLKKGWQHLDGDKAEQLVRFRSYPEGDIARMRVQSDFIQATIDELFSAANVLKINDLIKDISAMVDTNLSLNEMLSYAPHILSIERSKIQTHQLAGEARYIGGGSYVVPDYEGNARIRDEHFTPTKLSEAKSHVYISENIIGDGGTYKYVENTKPRRWFLNGFTSVDVLDATGGVADPSEFVDELKQYGYNIRVYEKTSAVFDETTVVSKAASSGAESVAKLSGANEYVVNPQKSSGSDVTIIVGKDFKK